MFWDNWNSETWTIFASLTFALIGALVGAFATIRSRQAEKRLGELRSSQVTFEDRLGEQVTLALDPKDPESIGRMLKIIELLDEVPRSSSRDRASSFA